VKPAAIIAPLIGAALVAAHLAAFPVLLERCDRPALAVAVEAPPAAPALTIDASIPAEVYARTTTTIDGAPGDLATAEVGPGMHRVEWEVVYRGGFRRSVGVTQLVGPFQDVAEPPCSVRLLIGQALLDDGQAGPGTIAHIARAQLERQMRGMSQWPIGSFERVESLSITWSGEVLKLMLVEVVLSFSRGSVPLLIGIVPTLGPGGVTLKAYANASVALNSRVYQWVADVFDANMVAGATAEQEVQLALVDAFEPPPPVPLPGGRTLRFEYCPHQPLEIVTGRYAAVPLRLRLDDARGDIIPITLGPAADHVVTELRAPLAIELSLDAINAILYETWRTGLLDQELGEAGLEARFNDDPAVQDLLSLRIDALALTLPPTAAPAPAPGDQGRFSLGAEAGLLIYDGARVTPARVYSTIGFELVGGDSSEVVAEITLRDLALSCEPMPGRLEPCYGDLVTALAGRSDELHGALTRQFTEVFNRLVLGRNLGASGSPADFTVDRAEVAVSQLARTAVVRVDLFGTLVEKP
jgi:hypothetical protein